MKKMSKVKMGMSKKLVKAGQGYSVTSQTTGPAKSGLFGLSDPVTPESRPYIPAPGAKRKQVTKERSDDGNYVTKEKKITTPQGSRTIQKKRRTALGTFRDVLYEGTGGRIGQSVPRPKQKYGGSISSKMKMVSSSKKSKKK